MKVHIGVDESLWLIYSITTTSANQHNITQVNKLLHGDENRLWGDAGYRGWISARSTASAIYIG